MTNPVGPSPGETSDDLKRVLAQLSVEQVRFVVARQDHVTDKEAAKAVGVSPGTVKNWKYNGYPIDEAVRLMALDGVIVALHLRRKALARAMLIKHDGLESRNERIRQSTATEFIEWELGKAMQPQQVTGAEGKDLIPVDELLAALKDAEKLLGDDE